MYPGIAGPDQSLQGRLRHKHLDWELSKAAQEGDVLIEAWKPDTAGGGVLGNRPPAPEVYRTPFLGSPLAAAAAFGVT